MGDDQEDYDLGDTGPDDQLLDEHGEELLEQVKISSALRKCLYSGARFERNSGTTRAANHHSSLVWKGVRGLRGDVERACCVPTEDCSQVRRDVQAEETLGSSRPLWREKLVED